MVVIASGDGLQSSFALSATSMRGSSLLSRSFNCATVASVSGGGTSKCRINFGHVQTEQPRLAVFDGND